MECAKVVVNLEGKINLVASIAIIINSGLVAVVIAIIVIIIIILSRAIKGKK